MTPTEIICYYGYDENGVSVSIDLDDLVLDDIDAEDK